MALIENNHSKKYKNKSYKKRSIRKRIKYINELRKTTSSVEATETNRLCDNLQYCINSNIYRQHLMKRIYDDCIKCNIVSPELLGELKCPHINVSSSQLYRFLFKRFMLADLHSIYYTGKNRRYGRIAEDFIMYEYPSIQKGFCLFSKKFPMICASPDGLEGKVIRCQRYNLSG